jgi:hypothetical protein
VHIDPPQASATQTMGLDKPEYLLVLKHRSMRKGREQFENFLPSGQVAAGQFASDKRMHDNQATFQQIRQACTAVTEMIDPD